MKLLIALLLPALTFAGTFVHSATATTVATCSPTPMTATLSVTSGNLLIVGIGSYGGYSGAPTDGVNTYTLAVRDTQPVSAFAELYYAKATTTASITVTIGTCGQWGSLEFAEYSGFGTTLSQAGGSSISGTGLSQTITAPDSGLVVSQAFDQTGGGYTMTCTGGGLSVRARADSGGGNANGGLADLLNSSAGSYAAQWGGWTTTFGVSAIIASFGSPGGTPARKTVLMH